jgi:hypothetical protein
LFCHPLRQPRQEVIEPEINDRVSPSRIRFTNEIAQSERDVDRSLGRLSPHNDRDAREPLVRVCDVSLGLGKLGSHVHAIAVSALGPQAKRERMGVAFDHHVWLMSAIALV